MVEKARISVQPFYIKSMTPSFVITSSDVYQFSKFLYWHTLQEIALKCSLKVPTHLMVAYIFSCVYMSVGLSLCAEVHAVLKCHSRFLDISVDFMAYSQRQLTHRRRRSITWRLV